MFFVEKHGPPPITSPKWICFVIASIAGLTPSPFSIEQALLLVCMVVLVIASICVEKWKKLVDTNAAIRALASPRLRERMFVPLLDGVAFGVAISLGTSEPFSVLTMLFSIFFYLTFEALVDILAFPSLRPEVSQGKR